MIQLTIRTYKVIEFLACILQILVLLAVLEVVVVVMHGRLYHLQAI